MKERTIQERLYLAKWWKLHLHRCFFARRHYARRFARQRDKLYDTAEIIMALPEGWNESQQAILKQAPVSARVCCAEGAELRLTFVRESEASVHYAMSSSKSREWLKVSSEAVGGREKPAQSSSLGAARLGLHPRRPRRLKLSTSACVCRALRSQVGLTTYPCSSFRPLCPSLSNPSAQRGQGLRL